LAKTLDFEKRAKNGTKKNVAADPQLRAWPKLWIPEKGPKMAQKRMSPQTHSLSRIQIEFACGKELNLDVRLANNLSKLRNSIKHCWERGASAGLRFETGVNGDGSCSHQPKMGVVVIEPLAWEMCQSFFTELDKPASDLHFPPACLLDMKHAAAYWGLDPGSASSAILSACLTEDNSSAPSLGLSEPARARCTQALGSDPTRQPVPRQATTG